MSDIIVVIHGMGFFAAVYGMIMAKSVRQFSGSWWGWITFSAFAFVIFERVQP